MNLFKIIPFILFLLLSFSCQMEKLEEDLSLNLEMHEILRSANQLEASSRIFTTAGRNASLVTNFYNDMLALQEQTNFSYGYS